MKSQVDPDSVGFLIADIARLFRSETDRRIAAAGLELTHGEGRALAHIARGGGVRQTVLAERMGVEPMTISGVVDRLEARGLVRRVTDPDDRRARIIVLTHSAEQPLDEIRRIAGDIRADCATAFPPQAWDRLRGDLMKLRDRLSLIREDQRAEESAQV